MADNKKAMIVIKKKKGGGGHGAHGGAWKVAYADFVTAMMAFFMVMWLMGSDDETKSSISHYFNHPNTPYKAGGDPDSKVTSPLGEREGSGDTMLNGQDGETPEAMVKDPGRSARGNLGENEELGGMINELMDGKIASLEINFDYVKFSIPEEVLFVPGKTELRKEADPVLKKLGVLLKPYKGYLTVTGHTNNTGKDTFEFSMAQAVQVMNSLTKRKLFAEDRVTPMGMGSRSPASQDGAAEKNRRIEFVLSRSKKM